VENQIQQPIDALQTAYQTAIGFLVEYSFQMLGAVLVLIAGFIVGGWVSRMLLRVQEKRDVDVTLRGFIASTVRLIVIVIFFIVALEQLSISITPLIAAIGGLAVGASFAIQGPVSNYGAGLVIILTRMFKVGDTVALQGHAGLVEEITLATTILRAEDGERIVIPNKHVAGEIHQNSYANRIIEGQVGISYTDDPQAAIAVIAEAVAQTHAVSEPKPQIGIAGFGDSSIDINYRCWVPTDRYFECLHEVNMQVWKALESANITIPFPQREVALLERK
jgi:small conductance mechanosensitive channel